MTPVEIIAAINVALNLAQTLYKLAQQVAGNEAIPTWEQILADNAALQAKIDAEKNQG